MGRALIVLAALIGCSSNSSSIPDAASPDPTPFVGVWSGTISQPMVTCPGGSAPAGSGPITLTLVASGAQLIWKAHCGDIQLTISGNTASHLDTVDCMVDASVGQSLTSISFMLSAGGLQVSFVDVFHDSVGDCNVPQTGTLSRT
jgi:hypothetical protein